MKTSQLSTEREEIENKFYREDIYLHIVSIQREGILIYSSSIGRVGYDIYSGNR